MADLLELVFELMQNYYCYQNICFHQICNDSKNENRFVILIIKKAFRGQRFDLGVIQYPRGQEEGGSQISTLLY